MRDEFYDFYVIAERSIGRQLARRLFRRLGGTRIYVSAELTDGNALVEAIGREAATVFCMAVLEGQEVGLTIKLERRAALFHSRRRAIVFRLNQRGVSASRLARRFAVDERTIYRWIGAEKKKERS